MLTIKSIKMENFLSYKKFFEDFSDKEIIPIVGLNQSGKTTIQKAVMYGVTGKVDKESATALIMHGEEIATVEIIFWNRETGDEYRVKRGVDTKGKSMLELDFHDKMESAQDALYNLLGVSAKEFEMTYIFEADSLAEFILLPNADKQEFLTKWFNNNHWGIADDEVKADLLKEQEILRGLNAKVTALSPSLVGDVLALQDEIAGTRANRALLVSQRDALRNKINDLSSSGKITSEAYRQAKDKRAELGALGRKVPLLTNSLNDLQGDLETLTEERRKVNAMYTSIRYDESAKDEMVAQRATFMHRIKTQSASISVLKKEMTGMCPILNKPCEAVVYDPKYIASEETSVKQLTGKVDKLDVTIAEVDKKINAKLSLQKLDNRILKIKNDIQQATDDLASCKRATKELNACESIIEMYESDIGEEIKRRSLELADLDSEVSDAERKLSRLEVMLENDASTRERIKVLELDIMMVKEQVADLSFLSYMFGRKGIQSLEIENGFSAVEDEINQILSDIKQEMRVRFSPDRETGVWEPVCPMCGYSFPKGYRKATCECGEDRLKKRKEDIQFLVDDVLGETSFYKMSTGAKALISIAVRIALTRLIQRQRNAQFNVLFLDEIDPSFDQQNVDKILSFVLDALKNKYGFTQIFWITHNQAIKDQASSVLSVTKRNGVSKVSWS